MKPHRIEGQLLRLLPRAPDLARVRASQRIGRTAKTRQGVSAPFGDGLVTCDRLQHP